MTETRTVNPLTVATFPPEGAPIVNEGNAASAVVHQLRSEAEQRRQASQREAGPRSLKQRYEEQKPREEGVAAIANKEQCIPGRKFKSLEFLTSGEGEFELSKEQDKRLYDEVDRVYRNIQRLSQDDPVVRRLRQVFEKQFPALRGRAEFVKGLRIQRNERIFHTEEELITALVTLEQHQHLVAASLACEISNNGQRTVEINVPSNTEIEAIIRDKIPNIAETSLGIVVESLKVGDFAGAYAAIGALVGSGGVVATEIISNFVGAAGAGGPDVAVAAALAGLAGAGIGLAMKTEFIVGRKAEKSKLRISLPKSDARVVTEYGANLGILNKTPEEILAIIERTERVRHEVWARAGVNLESLEQRAALNLDTLALDPTKTEITQGKGDIIYVNRRQEHLYRLLGNGERSLADLTAAEQLMFKLDASTAALFQENGQIARQIADEAEAKSTTERLSEAGQIDKLASEYEQGKRGLQVVDKAEVKAKQEELAEATEKVSQITELQEELQEVVDKLAPLQQKIETAKAARQVLTQHHETDLGTGETEIQQLGREIGELEDQIIGTTGIDVSLADIRRNIRIKQAEMMRLKREIETLKEEQRGISVKITNPTTGVKYTADEVKNEHARIRGEVSLKQQEHDNFKTEIEEDEGDKEALEERKKFLTKERQDRKDKLDRIRADIRAADTLVAEAEAEGNVANLKVLETERDRILAELALVVNPAAPPTLSVEEVPGQINLAQKEQARLQKEAEKLQLQLERFEAGQGRASPQDLQTAKILRRSAELVRPVSREGREGRFNEISGELVLNDELRVKLADPNLGYNEWLMLMFGPDAIAPDEMRVNRQVVSKADMVMAAVDVWRLDDGYFGRNQEGEFFLTAVRGKINRIASLQDQIAERERYQNPGWQAEIEALRGQIKALRQENNQELAALYDRAAHFFNSDPFKVREFYAELAGRVAKKALRGGEGETYERAQVRMGIRKESRQQVESREGYGVLVYEGPRQVEGTEVNHGILRFTTPPEHKIAGTEAKITLETSLQKPADSGDADALHTQISLQLTPELYEAMPDTRPAFDDWPPELLNAVYEAGAIGTARKKELAEVGGKVLQLEIDATDFDSLSTQLEAWKNLGDLQNLYPLSVGEAAVNMSQEMQEALFSNNRTVLITLGRGTPRSGSYYLKRDPATGQLIVNLQRTRGGRGRGIINNIPLKEFVSKYEDQYKRIRHIRLDQALTTRQRREMESEKQEFLKETGKEILRTLHRY